MKVLFVTHYPGFGGANQSCLHLARLLRERHGVEPILLAPCAGPIIEEARANGIRCDILRYASWRGPRTGMKSVAFGVMVLITNVIATVRAAWRYRNEQIDIVHANSSLAFFGWCYGKLTGKPIVWHLREYGVTDYPLNFYYGERFSGIIYGSSNAVIAISKDIERFYARFVRPLTRLQIVYNGIDVDLARRNMKDEDGALKDLQGFKIVFVGGINHAKNPFEILPALRLLKKKDWLGDVNLYIIGDGAPEQVSEFRDCARRLGVEDHVHLLGFRKNIWPLLSKMDLAIVPSVKEAFGRIAVECMLCGLPILASNAGALPEIVDDGETGFLFGLKDPEGLAAHIERIHDDQDLRLRLGAMSRHKAETQFSAQLNADRMFDVYQRIKSR